MEGSSGLAKGCNQWEGPLFPSLFSATIIYLPLVLFYLYFNAIYSFLSAYLSAHPAYVTIWSTNHNLWPLSLHPYHIPTLNGRSLWNLRADLQQYMVSPNKNTVFTFNAMRIAQHILKVTVQGPDESWATPYIHIYMLGGSLSPQQGVSSGCRWRNSLQLWRVAANILHKQPRTNDKGWTSSLEVGRGANNPSP
jgi:hypothetical protein